MPWFVSQKVPWERCWYITTTITITIVHNYVITSVLYVFYCHHSCLLLSLSLRFFVVFFLVYLRAYRGRALPKKHYGTKAVNTTTCSFVFTFYLFYFIYLPLMIVRESVSICSWPSFVVCFLCCLFCCCLLWTVSHTVIRNQVK